MKWMTRFLSLLFLFFTILFSIPATASLSALISIHEGQTDMWEQREKLQDLLHDRFGFEHVQFLVDATPEEIPGRLKKFLEQDAGPDDRRLVWISGLNNRQNDSVCANRSFDTIKSKAASLIMAPACYTDVIALPQGSRHFSITAPVVGKTAARIGRTRAVSAPWIAVLTLPSDNEAVIQGTNALIFEHLNAAAKNHMDPAALLQHIRVKFRWNGSDYTPTLDLFDRGLSRESLRPFGLLKAQRRYQPSKAGVPAQMRKSSFGLYTSPEALDGLSMSVNTQEPVRTLRRNRDDNMRFVAIGADYFGWVKIDDLVE